MGYGAGGCANVTRMQNVYRKDMASGHPAAANDAARKMKRCGTGGYPYAQSGFPFAQSALPFAQGGLPYAQNGYPYAQSGFGPSVRNFLGLW
jgi:hypothetical protein